MRPLPRGAKALAKRLGDGWRESAWHLHDVARHGRVVVYENGAYYCARLLNTRGESQIAVYKTTPRRAVAALLVVARQTVAHAHKALAAAAANKAAIDAAMEGGEHAG